MAKRVGVILGGCGVQDGSEIHEAVLTLYALDRAGAHVTCLAPDRDQADVVDHLTGQPTAERRNVLQESARIARGKIKDIATARASELDAVVIPGGFGAAKNLSSFARDGAKCEVDPGVARLLKDMRAQHKPIGALCIAPAILARLFGEDGVTLTIGDDAGTAGKLEQMGARHRKAAVDEVVVDAERKILTTPCYMLAGRIAEVGRGAERLVAKLLEMA